MKNKFTIFLITLLIFALVQYVTAYFLSQQLLQGKITSITYGILLYFVVITALFHFGLVSSSKGNPKNFIRYYMGATTFKLLMHLAVIVIYCLFINRSQALAFIVNFVVFYLLFTVFEVIASMKQFRNK